ncbi:hypothetical protein HJD18_16360 [Thermoleophilia bacterium SCSIO 60948]|nr:hypothetical protein HJD18_16360 [Thermoleophilia bacterium SCSIO 60948]
MISRARELAERPIGDRERPRLFVAATIVLVITAAVLLAAGRGDETPAPPLAPPSSPATRPPEPEPEAPAVPPEAEQAARRFLPGYLSFLYGRRGPSAIEAAAPALRREIVRSRPRVPPAARRRRPRVVEVRSVRLGSQAISVAAEVADGGVSHYTITLKVRPIDGRWIVVEVGSD